MCPLLMLGDTANLQMAARDTECQEHDCAWFVRMYDGEHACAVLILAKKTLPKQEN